ncbi:MAG: hypothetical protein AAF438_13255 [Pseudomonadota bacterium]
MGTTLQDRIAAAMENAGLSEHELLTACESLVGEDLVNKLALLNLIRRDSTTQYSPYVSVIAEATGVKAVWLQWGVGEMMAGPKQ